MSGIDTHVEQNERPTGTQTGSMIPPIELLRTTNPFEWYEEMRRKEPVRYDAQRQTWDLFLYDDIQKTLIDYKTFSSQMGNEISLLGMDPPEHKLYRSIVSQAFTPIAIEKMAPRIEQITRELLDEKMGRGEMDIIRDLAFPLPVIVIAEMLGAPPQDRELFKKWSDALVADVDIAAGQTPEQLMEEKQNVANELYAYFSEVIEEHEKRPQNNLIAALLQARVGEEALDRQTLLSFCLLLLVAGNETTTNLIGNAMATFLEQPKAMEKLREDISLLQTAIEEVLRFRSPIQSLSRIVTIDIGFGENRFQAGDRVTVWLGSGNRDEKQFEDADQFILDRHPNAHLGFGHGIHLCIGAALARLEAKTALSMLLTDAPALSLREPLAHRLPSSFIYGYESIPVVFQPFV